MRRLFSHSLMMLASVVMFATSCEKKETPNDTTSPKVSLDIKSVSDSSATLSITAQNAEEVYLYCIEAGEVCDNETIKTKGELVVGSEATIDNLSPERDYVAYALAIKGDRSAKAEKSFTTQASTTQPFEGHELNKLVDAVYRNDNNALAGNYEITFGNTTKLEWAGDIQIFLDLYNVEDSDPLNPVLPNGVYEPGTDNKPFTYNPAYSYVDILVEGGETVSTPIMGIVTVERSGATYSITVEGTLMLLDDMEFSARYTGNIAFVQGGTSAYEFFEEDVTVEFSDAQMRYWGSWFYPFADNVGIEMFSGDFDENGNITRGYYLHFSSVYMPKYADYNAKEIPLAEGTYEAIRPSVTIPYFQPYCYNTGAIDDFYGERYFTGTYLQYIEGGEIKKVGLVSGGSVVVEHTADGYNITMNFVANNGVKFNLSFNGSLISVNLNDNDTSMTPRPWTTLANDHVYNFPEESECYVYCFGEMIAEGYDSWMIMIFGANSEYPDGYGDMFTSEFVTAKGDRTTMPVGEYRFAYEIGDRVMFPGTTSYAGAILFSYYGDLTPDAEGYSSHTAPISSGKVVVEEAADGNYRFIFDMVDDGGNKITGEWSGKPLVEDLSEDVMQTSTLKANKLQRCSIN